MKYQVQIKFTNPSHEHVSLRRRVDKITRVVEAANEAEALNRAANQQRSLGFLIKEAAVMNSPKEENLHADEKEKKKKKVVGDDNEQTDIAASGGVKEGFDPEPSDIAAQLVKKHGKGKVTKDHVDEYERDRDSNKAIDKEAVMKHVQKMSEEVESVEEGVATAQKVMDRANVVAKTNPDPKKRFAAGGLANKAMMRTINPTGVNTGITRGGGNKAYRKITGKAPPHQLTKKTGVSEEVVAEASKEGESVIRGMRASMKAMDLRHGVDSDKREAGYKMSPAVRAAQAKSDALSKKIKRPQAGTLAAVHKSMEREMLKKEAVENNGKQKARKAAEKMVNKAKGKANKVNLTPEIEPGKPNA